MKKNNTALLLAILCSIFNTTYAQKKFKYYDAYSLKIVGMPFKNVKSYERLPLTLKKSVRIPIWYESLNSTGIAIQFETNSSSIAVKWKSGDSSYFPHVAGTLVKGLDLYCWQDGKWYFAGVGKPYSKVYNEGVLISNMENKMRRFILNLPMYETVDSIYIGIDSNAQILSPNKTFFLPYNPIVFYGTSIVQGASASRPGMCYPSILSRRLNIETINLGFSGNGLLDLEIAEIMSEIKASCYVIDCGPNLTEALVKQRLIKFITLLHKKKPDTPIILVENINYPTGRFDMKAKAHVSTINQEFNNAFNYLKKQGINNLFYINQKNLIGNDGDGTVDGIHLTDLGFYRLANVLEAEINKIGLSRK